MKKLVSFLLVIAMLSSMVVVGTSAVANEVTSSGYESSDERCISLKDAIKAYETENNVKVETYRNYFYIPETADDYLGKDTAGIPGWCNEYSDSMYIWYSSSMAENSPIPEGYCGYKIEKLLDNVYYADIPVGVVQFSINNGVEAEGKPVYSTCSTPVLGLEAADKYGKFPNHDGEIYVMNQFDRENTSSTAYFKGTWYQYKGMDCYGTKTNRMCLHPKHEHKTVSQGVKDFEELTGEKVETNRYYFLMPNGKNGDKGNDDSVDEEGNYNGPYYDKFASSWYNEYTTGAGIYWWDSGVADPQMWPGYTMETTSNSNIYYADVPKDVTTIIFNNNVNGGIDHTSEMYYQALQSINVPCEYYDVGESPNYPDGVESFNNMIFVIDPDPIAIGELTHKITYGGEWYYYYGNGCYGFKQHGNMYDCLRADHEHTMQDLEEDIAEYEAQTGEKVELNRYYFLMPNGENGQKGDDNSVDYEGYPRSEYYDKFAPSWYNEYTKGAGIYWWDSGIVDPDSWPGYSMYEGDSECIYYADVPKAVQTLIFNNFINGGMDHELPVYWSSQQSVNVQCEFYYPGESETYPDGIDSFDNMIFVIDPDLNSNFESYPRTTWGGEWYYYYGNGCFGSEKNGDSTHCLRDDHEHNVEFAYVVLSDGTAKITRYKGTAEELTIPSTIDGYTVTAIGNKAFASRHSLKSITIPSSVTSIGDMAFSECLNLAEINIPASVTNVGGDAFEKTLWYVKQPNGCVYINNLFYSYKGYAPENTEVVIKDGTTAICNRAFNDCKNIIKITIPDSVTRIGDYAFSSCSWFESIEIPDSVTSIGVSAFSNCSMLTEIKLPDSIKTIERNTFYSCSNLTEIVISDSVTSIGDSAFEYCKKLRSVTIGNSVTTISNSAFRNCRALTGVNIPDSVTTIADKAFEYCEKLDAVVIPESVTAIGDRVFYDSDNSPIIYGYENTYAQEYAEENNFEFKIVCLAGGVHAQAVTPEYMPTFTKPGRTEGLHCVACGEVLKEQELIPFGDVDGDGVVTIMDATAIQNHMAKIKYLKYEEWIMGDADADRCLTVFDATMIQKRVANLA